MILVVVTVVLATAAGVLLEHRVAWAVRSAELSLSSMLYLFVPLISYTSFAHLHLTLAAGVGLVLAYCGLGLAALFSWWLGRRIGASRQALGGMIVCALIVNTGYLGFPMSVALLGPGALSHAVAYDRIVSSPLVFTAGFAVGAAFGDGHRTRFRDMALSFFTRNPPLWGAVLGLLVPAAWAPPELVTVSRAVVDVTLVLGFLAVGIYLASERREDHAPLLELPNRQVLGAMAGRFLINPALLGLVALAGVGIPSAYLLQALMPSGISCLIIGHAYGLNQRMIATVIVWSTIIVLVVATVFYLA